MKKQIFTMSTGSCAALYELLRDAKLTGMDGAAKLRVVAILHSLRPAAHKLEAVRKDCINMHRHRFSEVQERKHRLRHTH